MSREFVDQALVLQVINYSENSVIVKFFSREHGLISCFAQKKKGSKGANYLPFSLCEIEYYSKKASGLFSLRSCKIISPYTSLYCDPLKTTILLFLSEVLVKTVKEDTANPELFSFLRREFLYFDQLEDGISNFHLYFLSHLITHLGFKPLHGDGKFFNLEEGDFVDYQPSEKHFDEAESKMFLDFLQSSGEDIKSICVNRSERSTLLKGIVNFYRFHCAGFGELKSMAVMEEVYI